jgi:hypothetical protein
MLIRIFCACLLSIMMHAPCFGQQNARFSLSASYGPQLNFFASDFDEVSGPQPHQYFYNKKTLGTIAGLELRYELKGRSFLELGYHRSVNKAAVNYFTNLNGVDILIEDFNLRYINNFFQLGYGQRFKRKKSAWTGEMGLVYLTTADQSILYDGAVLGGPVLEIEERNLANSGMEELGVFAGFAWELPIDTKLYFSLRARGYYLVSINFFEALTFTPVLRYRFGK